MPLKRTFTSFPITVSIPKATVNPYDPCILPAVDLDLLMIVM